MGRGASISKGLAAHGSMHALRMAVVTGNLRVGHGRHKLGRRQVSGLEGLVMRWGDRSSQIS